MADKEPSYGFRLADAKTGRYLSGADEIASPHLLGNAMSRCLRDVVSCGHKLEDIEARAIAVEDGKPRDLTDEEFAAAQAALEQLSAQWTRERTD